MLSHFSRISNVQKSSKIDFKKGISYIILGRDWSKTVSKFMPILSKNILGTLSRLNNTFVNIL